MEPISNPAQNVDVKEPAKGSAGFKSGRGADGTKAQIIELAEVVLKLTSRIGQLESDRTLLFRHIQDLYLRHPELR